MEEEVGCCHEEKKWATRKNGLRGCFGRRREKVREKERWSRMGRVRIEGLGFSPFYFKTCFEPSFENRPK
jgi:hypothetical protein